MRVLAISGNPKSSGALATLTEEAARGAAETGAEVEFIRLAEQDINCCRFCLTCFEDMDSQIAECVQKDDMEGILRKIVDTDGFILSCPMSGGRENSYMKIFEERCVLTLCRATKRMLHVKGIPESRIADKQRYAVTITTAGIIPNHMRIFFNGSTKEMRGMAKGVFNAKVVGSLFAGRLVYRGLSKREKKKAYRLGKNLAESIRAGG
jgi:multimeric flavodoxin WrbA